MPSLSWTFAFALSMVSLAFDIEGNCLAGQRLDEDLHATTQCVLLGFGSDGLRRLRDGTAILPSSFCDSLGFLRSEHVPSSGTLLHHSVPSMFFMLHVSCGHADHVVTQVLSASDHASPSCSRAVPSDSLFSFLEAPVSELQSVMET